MTSLTCGLDKWESHRETGEMGTAPIFNHFYTQKCGLDESSPYNTPYNMNKIALINQAPTEESIPREMGPVPIFTKQDMFNFF